jgi:transposase
VPAHTRRKPKSDFTDDGTSAPFFDESKLPVQTIEVPNPEAQALAPEQYEVIGEKVSFRLAQRPGSYVVLKYVRAVIKRRDTQTLHCPAAPTGVIEGSRADVSFLAGVVIDKFAYHLPLYRQHQRLGDTGITVSRPWLTQLVQQAAQLAEPIYDAQFDSIRGGRVKAMDETPIKAGRAGPGKLKSGYFWPVYGELDEVCFPYFESRRHEHVQQALGLTQAPGSVLLSDGYEAYARYAEKTRVTHAQCWVHCRRGFFDALGAEPQAAGEALRQIAVLYEIEEEIQSAKLTGEAKRVHRLTHSKPLVEAFFEWVERQFEQQGLLPSAGVCARAPRGAAGVPHRCRRADGHEPSGARAACDPDGQKELVVLLERGRRQARGHPAEPDRHLPAARDRPVHVLRRRPAARGPAPGVSRGRAHAAAVETALRRQPASLGSLQSDDRLGKNADSLPLTAR